MSSKSLLNEDPTDWLLESDNPSVRARDAFKVLLRKQGNDGRWILESSPIGRMHATLEQKGKPSKWISFNALKVINRINI
jgi:hypothetical protein